MSPIAVDPGSFRDRDGRVFQSGGRIFRGLSLDAKREWDRLKTLTFWREAQADHRVVRTSDAPHNVLSEPAWDAVLEHERIPFISYPYEWSFGMLKDAALSQLDLMLAALAEDTTLIDASAYNTQWRGASPLFIDVPSLRSLKPGEPWIGYRQFCQLFLYPLMLQAYRHVGFQPWLRGRIDGIDPVDMNGVMSFRDLFRSGVFTHVYLHSKLQSRYGATNTNVKQELLDAGFSRELITSNVRGMRGLVNGLSWGARGSEWSDYVTTRSYNDQDLEQKRAFVQRVAARERWKLVWDLGCNTGEFSELVSTHADYVVAMDSDPLAVDLFYRRLKQQRSHNILSLVGNLADQPAGLGWRGKERQSLSERGKPDLTLALALIHHVVLSANILLEDFVAWLAEITQRTLVIEFVTRDDDMVKTLLRNKEDKFIDYDEAHFRNVLERHFDIVERLVLKQGCRVLYHAKKR